MGWGTAPQYPGGLTLACGAVEMHQHQEQQASSTEVPVYVCAIGGWLDFANFMSDMGAKTIT